MTETVELAYTTTEQRVIAIKRLEKCGDHTMVTAIVEDQSEKFHLEYQNTYSLHDFKSLDGAKAALDAYQQSRTDDEEDDRFFSCLQSVLLYVTSCFASTTLAKRSSRIEDVPQCKPDTFDTQPPTFSNDDAGMYTPPLRSMEKYIRRPNHGSYQCCGISFRCIEPYIFHLEKHRRGEDRARTQRDTTDIDSIHNSFRSMESFASKRTLIDYERPTSVIVLNEEVPPTENTQRDPQLLLPTLSQPSHWNLSRCCVLDITKRDYLSARVLAGWNTESGTVLQLAEMDWTTLNKICPAQLKIHMPEHTYKLVKTLSRLGLVIGDRGSVWVNKSLEDVGLCPEGRKSLLAGQDVQISEQTRITFDGWMELAVCKAGFQHS